MERRLGNSPMTLNAETETIYKDIPGGPEMIEWFGHVPSFHDAEIVGLWLNRHSSSFLHVHGFSVVADKDGFLKSEQHAVVTFELRGISYLSLEGFRHQNVIGGLQISRGRKDPAKSSYYDFNATEDDFELLLEPCYGLDGLLRCNSISVTFKPGKPDE
jgi:hypothetical protein